MNPFDNLLDRLICLEARGKTSFVSKYPSLADIPTRIKDYNAQLVRQKMGIKDDTKLKIEVSGLPYKVIKVVSRLLYRADIISNEEMDGLTKRHGIAAKIRYLDGLIQQYNADLQPGQPGKDRLDAFINQGGLDSVVAETFGTKKQTTMAGEVAQAEQKQATKDAVEQVFDELTPGQEEYLLTRVMFGSLLLSIDNDDELIEDIANDAKTSMPEVRKIIDMLRGRISKINTVDDIVKLNRKLVAIPGMQKIAAMIKGSIIDVIPSEVERVRSLDTDDEIDDTMVDEEPKSLDQALRNLKITDFDTPEEIETAKAEPKVRPTPPATSSPTSKLASLASSLTLDDFDFLEDEEQESMDDACNALKKSLRPIRENTYVSFRDKYKPTTSWQLNELRGYGL